jgi:outer membrane protein OmpA-like peptidoglycan-associated protein
MRIAAFADYGVLSMTQPSQGAMAYADEKQVYTRSLYASDWANGRLNSLMVGLKFTAALQMNKPQPPPPQRPALALFVTDCHTEQAVAQVNAEFTQTQLNAQVAKKAKGVKKSQKSGKKKKPRVIKRVTDREGKAVAKMPSGTYHIQLTHPNYTSLEQEYEHGLWGDTLRLAICERPYFRLYVRDALSDSLLASHVTFINESNDSIATLHTDSVTGFAQIRLPMNKQIRIRIEAEDHFALAEHIEDIGAEVTYRLNRIEKEKKIVLHNLFFATNKTVILPQSEPAMQDLYEMLAAHPEYRILVIGHTDNVGTDRFNQRLSEGRANSVRNDLIQRGIDPERIEAEGRGESQPITTNDTDEGRAQNRRVEFILIQQ